MPRCATKTLSGKNCRNVVLKKGESCFVHKNSNPQKATTKQAQKQKQKQKQNYKKQEELEEEEEENSKNLSETLDYSEQTQLRQSLNLTKAYDVAIVVLKKGPKKSADKGQKKSSDQSSSTIFYNDESWITFGQRFQIPNASYKFKELEQEAKKRFSNVKKPISAEWVLFDGNAEQVNLESDLGPPTAWEKKFYFVPLLSKQPESSGDKNLPKARFYITMGPPASGKSSAWKSASEMLDREKEQEKKDKDKQKVSFSTRSKAESPWMLVVDDFVSSNESYKEISQKIAKGIQEVGSDQKALGVLCEIGFSVYQAYRFALQGGEDLSNILFLHLIQDTELRKRNWDVVWETTGGGGAYEWLKKVAAKARKANYTVVLVYPVVDVETLIKRSTERAKVEGRLPCESSIRQSQSLSLFALKSKVLGEDKKIFDYVFVFDNNPEGGKGTLVLYCNNESSCTEKDPSKVKEFGLYGGVVPTKT